VNDNLDVQPTNLDQALLRILLLNPTPSECYAFLPGPLAWMFLGLDDTLTDPNLPSLLPRNAMSLTAADLSRLDEMYPLNKGRPGGKVHLDPSGAYRSMRSNMTSRRIARFLLDRDNSETQWESTFASALILLPALSRTARDLFTDYFFSRPIFHLDVPSITKRCKEIHTAIRVTRSLPTAPKQLTADQARELYGVDLLYGPSESHKMSFADEILQRITPSALNAVPRNTTQNPLSTQDYDALFSLALKEIIREDFPHTVRWPTFEEWYSNRLGWAAGGGAPGSKLHWDDSTERLNKRGALLSIPVEHVLGMLRNNSHPIHYSKGATKFEKGKKRAIWNTSIYHYLYQAYVLDCLDAHLRSNDSPPDGPAPANWNASTHHAAQRASTQFARLAQLADGNAGLMWDFSDFNINHSLASMAELFATLGRTLSARLDTTEGPDYLAQVKQDFEDCVAWISKARVNTILDTGDPDSPLVAEILRSLQSGERATSFTNTFCNRVYLKVADFVAQDLFGRQLLVQTRYQQGDDVFCVANSVFDGVIQCGLLNICGAAGQVYKITLDYSGRGEFLRYSYDARARTIGGYPVRSALGLISGEFFMDPIIDPDARAVAYLEAFNRANLRGAILPRALLDTLISRNCSVTFTTPSGTKVRVPGDVEYALTPAALGGLGATGYPPLRAPSGQLRGYQSTLTRPIFKPPRFDASRAFSQFSYADQNAISRLGLSQTASRTVHDIAARSALTGAYKSGDLSHSIARYAEDLFKYKKSLTRTNILLPDYSFDHLRLPILSAWAAAFGLLSSDSDLESSRPFSRPIGPGAVDASFPLIALILPSGGGKSWLARQYPDLFIDHDDYTPYSRIKALVDAKEWDVLNQQHRTRPVPRDGRVLLTWGPETVPLGFVPVMVPLVSGFVGPRLFIDNLAAIRADHRSCALIREFSDFSARTAALRQVARRAKTAFDNASFEPNFGYSYTTFSSASAPLHYYGAAALLTRPAGFSLQEAMNAAVSKLEPVAHTPGRLGRWYALIRTISPNRRPKALNEILAFLSSPQNTEHSLANRLDYFTASISWLPPAAQNHSPDIMTLARDISLTLLEQYCSNAFGLPRTELVTYVHQLERLVTYLFETVITPSLLANVRFLG
jgi:hypothetical protein